MNIWGIWTIICHSLWLSSQYTRVIVCGDLNIHFENRNDKTGVSLLIMMNDFGSEDCIQGRPTHRCNGSHLYIGCLSSNDVGAKHRFSATTLLILIAIPQFIFLFNVLRKQGKRCTQPTGSLLESSYKPKRATIGYRSFDAFASPLWNSLPLDNHIIQGRI